jgi:hypothetical protein
MCRGGSTTRLKPAGYVFVALVPVAIAVAFLFVELISGNP